MDDSHYLYFWPVDLPTVGHISMSVWCPEKDEQIYISHWPNKRTFYKREKGQRNQQTLLHDITVEDNRKPEVVEIPFDFIDPVQNDRWLPIDTKNPEKPYNLTTWNCANVVATALQIGLKARNLQLELERNFMETRISPLTPKEVFSWIQKKVQLDKQIKEQRPLRNSAPQILYPCAPEKPTDDFSGHSTQLLKVCETVRSSLKKTLVVTAGTGGAGKTEFARKVAEIVLDFFEARVFWMDSETVESLQKCLLDLAAHLKIPHDFRFETSMTMSKEQMKSLLLEIYSHFSSRGQNSLFIFDNAKQFKPKRIGSSTANNKSVFLISDFLPNSFSELEFSPCPTILITSRSSDWSESTDFQMINLENFTLEETKEYFKKTFKPSDEQLKDCQPEIELLHKRFGGHTLAFTLAAGWIRAAGFSKNLKEGLKCYIQLFEQPSNNLHGKENSSSKTNYKWSPHEIMEQTCVAIGRENPLALQLLRQMSFLSPDFFNYPQL